jgi:arabinan endo-1,5-alpha-L-arabinosidase
MKNYTLIVLCIALAMTTLLIGQNQTDQTDQIKISAQSGKVEKPESPNPWADDYTEISAMQNYLKWGTYNVHDPSCKLFGDTYYMYSTDAIFRERRRLIQNENLPFGNIQVRTSKDLVHWEFKGWAFDSIPQEAKEWVLEQSGGKGATNIWAPYVLEYQGRYRLYYSVSAFGLQTSYIGLAESDSPLGPWELKGCVVKTKRGDKMNAIDPSIVADALTGEQWMHYGSYFGGLYCVQLNPETGLTLHEGDQGHLTARRYDGRKNNNEAPEIIYNPKLNKYFLFVSYDPLMTTYNVRVGRSDSPEGPFIDYFGRDFREETDNLPLLTYPYRFENHPGWAGTGHCAVFSDAAGDFYMAHQARLSPDNHMMVLHVRKIFWTEDGWPVVSPERYAGIPDVLFTKEDVAGVWEWINLSESMDTRDLEAGQVLWGENQLRKNERCESVRLNLHADQTFTTPHQSGRWWYIAENLIQLVDFENRAMRLHVHAGQDWENERITWLATGLDSQGRSVWAKKIE